MTNRLYYGDNLDVLREHILDESVDLIYLDPPFNSNAGYNVLFRSASGAGADASIEAFDDTWTWGDASKAALMDIAGGTNRSLQVMMEAMRQAVGENPLMAYLAMMAVRLVELHRVLKPTGSLYLHCDPTASHYLKLVLDAVFGAEQFRNEIVWKRTTAHSSAKRFAPVHDTIFYYTKNVGRVWNEPRLPYDDAYLSKYYKFDDGDGRLYWKADITGAGPRTGESGKPWRSHDPAKIRRHWAIPKQVIVDAVGSERAASMTAQEKLDVLESLGAIYFPSGEGMPQYKRYRDQLKGLAVGDIWADVDRINPVGGERLGYPTQKPRALLERIIAASSNPGDVLLDPFCGCGTAVDAAEKLGRRWIGIDVTHLAIGMIEDRMRSGYPGIAFETIGVPRDLASAERLAVDDPHQFQQWVCWQVGGYPREKKGGDKGVDGWFNYQADDRGHIETGVISVKAGDNVNPNMVRDLGRVMERDKHRFGLFVMKGLPTKGMRDEAASHPLVETQFGRFPALQIVTLAELMLGRKPGLPTLISPMKKAARVETRTTHQKGSQAALL